MKIVVTGSGGQLGSELCRQLEGTAVGLDLPEFDLTDRQGVPRRLETLRPDVVINTAAYTRVDEAEERPELARAINADGVAHLVEACRRLDCLLVQISTDYVFGGDAGRTAAYRETDPTAPLNVYGRTKLAGERHAAAWAKHLIVRTSGLYGRLGERSSGNFVADHSASGEGRPATRSRRRSALHAQLRAARRPGNPVSDRHVGSGHVPRGRRGRDDVARLRGRDSPPVRRRGGAGCDFLRPARRRSPAAIQRSRHGPLSCAARCPAGGHLADVAGGVPRRQGKPGVSTHRESARSGEIRGFLQPVPEPSAFGRARRRSGRLALAGLATPEALNHATATPAGRRPGRCGGCRSRPCRRR